MGANFVHFLLRRVQKAFFPRCDLFTSSGNKSLGGWVSANTICSVIRQYRCVLLLGREERKEAGVSVLHCRRGWASHRLMWYVFSSTSCLEQQLAYLAEIISLSLGVFSFIVKDKIKILLTAFFEWNQRKTMEVFSYVTVLCIVCVVSANFHRGADKMVHLFFTWAIKQPLSISWQPVSRHCMASWEPGNSRFHRHQVFSYCRNLVL